MDYDTFIQFYFFITRPICSYDLVATVYFFSFHFIFFVFTERFVQCIIVSDTLCTHLIVSPGCSNIFSINLHINKS